MASKRYQQYNDSLDKVEALENDKQLFAIRPSQIVEVARLEKNPDKFEQIYNLGLKDGQEILPSLQDYLETKG